MIVTRTVHLYRHRNLLHLHPFNFIFLIARETERKHKIANHNLMSFLGRKHFMYKSVAVILKGKLNPKVSKDKATRRLQMEKKGQEISFKVTNLGMLMFLWVFSHIDLYRCQCFWSYVNRKHFQSWKKREKAFFQVWKPKWSWNEHVLMFKRDKGGKMHTMAEKKAWPYKIHLKWSFEPVGNVVIDLKNRCCFFPVDIAGYENWHLVVAIFCSQKNKPQLFCIECNANVVWVHVCGVCVCVCVCVLACVCLCARASVWVILFLWH